MTLVRGLLRFRLSFSEPSAGLLSIRESPCPPRDASVRYLCSPAASEVAEPAKNGGAARAPWTPQSRRTGAIAIKLGMTQMWNAQGDPVPVTVLQVRRKRHEYS